MQREPALMDSAFFDTYVWPALIVTAHSLAIILALLISLAFFMLADRKIWAAAQHWPKPTAHHLTCLKTKARSLRAL